MICPSCLARLSLQAMRIQSSKIIVSLLLLLSSSMLFADNGQSQQLCGMRVSAQAEKSRLVFDFKETDSIKYHAFALTAPNRIVIDLPSTRLFANLNHPALINTLVKNIRSSAYKNQNLRLVFDLKEPVSFKCLTLEGVHSAKEKRLVLDLFKIGNPKLAKKKLTSLKKPILSKLPPVIGPIPEPTQIQPSRLVSSEDEDDSGQAASNRAEESNVSATLLRPKVLPRAYGKLRDITIVIDPGHGGEDSGAVGANGIREKNVVLAISKHLQRYLNREAGFRALLTRNGDYFISLRDRLNIAHYDHADLFIAIHADACDKTNRRGASVYALSQRGATSELAHWLAEKENASELGHVISDKNLLLKSVLIDLAQTLTINNSLLMGNIMLQELSEVTGLHIFHVEQAAFVVLKSPDIPSLLVETGFISNPYEEKRLNDNYYQQKIAYALAQGIKEYFIQHPSPGTYFSIRKLAAR